MTIGRDREEFKRSYAAHARANARVCSLGKEPDVTSSRVCLPPSLLTNESSSMFVGPSSCLTESVSFPAASSIYALPRALNAMERPLEAEPVSAANTLVATRHERSALNLRFTRND